MRGFYQVLRSIRRGRYYSLYSRESRVNSKVLEVWVTTLKLGTLSDLEQTSIRQIVQFSTVLMFCLGFLEIHNIAHLRQALQSIANI
jgi:hypothetical protein